MAHISRHAILLLFAVAALTGCGAGAMPNVNDSFDDLACASRDFQGEESC
ncbi:hypothetical protein [Pararhizobium haloflavum]|nr:hypothetical protein [Pararhizobium haloflavum]